MADLTTLLAKFLGALYGGTVYSSPLGASSVGMPVIQAVGSVTGVSAAATASLVTVTVGSADGTFEYGVTVTLTTAGSANFTGTITYTDESNTARTTTVDWAVGGSFPQAVTTAGQYAGTMRQIRAKAGTTITIGTNAGGTYTGCVYNAFGVLKQVA